MNDMIITSGIYNFHNKDGTIVPVDIGKLPVTNKPANFIIPNVWIAGEDDPEPTGLIHGIPTPLIWVDVATKKVYRTTAGPA
jgi:hypothetical protein